MFPGSSIFYHTKEIIQSLTCYTKLILNFKYGNLLAPLESAMEFANLGLGLLDRPSTRPGE